MRTDSLRNFVKLRQQLTREREALGARLQEINEALGEIPVPSVSPIEGTTGETTPKGGASLRRGRRTMSPEARARIAAAQRARWAVSRKAAGLKAGQNAPSTAGNQKTKRRMSAAGRKAIAEAARKRWAAAKAAGKTRL